MLQYQPNIERMFHHVLLDAIPLLFLAPEDYRNALAKEFDALYYQYRSGGSEVQITDGIDTITKMMVGAGDHWGSRTKDQIRVFRSMWQGFDERIAALERRIVTRKPKRKIKKPDVIAEPGTVPEPVNVKKNQTEQVLQYITEHPGETSREIAIGVGIVARSCDNALSWLQRKAVIRKEGEKKRYRYYGTETTVKNEGTETIVDPKTLSITGTVLKYIKENPGERVGTISNNIRRKKTIIRNAVGTLIKQGKIRHEGPSKKYRYYPIE